MPPVSLVDLAHNYGGVLWQLNAEPEVSAVSIDSRTMSPGDCFVAIRGDRFDAHDFLDEVIEKGAASLVVEAPQQRDVLQWVVEDSVKALGQIAREHRKLFHAPVVAITGSNGKTSVKEMLSSILSLSGNTLATKGNLNNEIGVPLTLLRLEESHRFAVIEMGASHLGDIKYLSELAEPDVALVNNVGEAHLEKFGSVENIQRAKGEIYGGLKPGGTAIVNLDSIGAGAYIRSLQDCQYIGFSMESAEAEVRAENIQLTPDGAIFDLWLGTESVPISLAVPARHNVANALAAAACAQALDVSASQIAAGLERFGGVSGRLEFVSGINGCKLIDDSYNASPTSASAAVDLLASLAGERVLVLGDMAELGANASQLHAELGQYAQVSGLDQLVATGPLSRAAVDAFGVGARWFEGQAELTAYLREQAKTGSHFLIKGSRSAAMDKVVEELKESGVS